MAVCDPERPRRAGKTVKQVGAPPACSHSGWFRASRSDNSPHMPNSGRCVLVYLCVYVHIASGCVDHQFSLEFMSWAAPIAD